MVFLIAVTMGVAWLGLHYLSNFQDSLSRYTDASLEVHLGTQANQVLLRIGQMEKNILLAQNRFDREAVGREFQEYQGELETLLEQLHTAGSPATRRRLLLFREHLSQYTNLSTQLFTLAQQTEKGEAYELSAGKIRELREAAEEIMRAIIDANYEKNKHRLNQERDQANVVIWIMLVASAAGIAISIGVYVALILFNVRPELLRATRAVATISDEIGETVDRQSVIASQQAVSVTEIFSTIKELTATARQSSEQADSAASMAERSKELALSGQERVREMEEGMTSLKSSVTDTEHHFEALRNQIGKVGEITDLMKGFANDTKMLAMNAAVEAARAGEHGKGFSSLAVEVRKLAEESKKSAERIRHLVSEILHMTLATKQVTQASATSVDRSIHLVQETAHTFKQVSDSVVSGSESTRQISLNLQQQATAVRQVGEVMTNIRDGAKNTADGARQIKSGLEIMRSAAGDLNRMV
ncbi:MAG: MCP four helix bundle domain-containing protein [Magnetococcales bacterium]|nr:MCP four helix bundle domain-containing protein [Magnetococcales bacterium]